MIWGADLGGLTVIDAVLLSLNRQTGLRGKELETAQAAFTRAVFCAAPDEEARITVLPEHTPAALA